MRSETACLVDVSMMLWGDPSSKGLLCVPRAASAGACRDVSTVWGMLFLNPHKETQRSGHLCSRSEERRSTPVGWQRLCPTLCPSGGYRLQPKASLVRSLHAKGFSLSEPNPYLLHRNKTNTLAGKLMPPSPRSTCPKPQNV